MRFVALALLLSSLSSVVFATEPSRYDLICESARLRAVERAECHAQMHAATSDQQRQEIYRAIEARLNGEKVEPQQHVEAQQH